jgi:hypothetical protein
MSLTASDRQRSTKAYLKEPEIDEQRTSAKMEAAFIASEAGQYKTKSPKQHPPFFEDYYGLGIPEDKRIEAMEKVTSCVRNFIASDIYNKLVGLAGEGKVLWRHIDGSECESAGKDDPSEGIIGVQL